MAWGIRAVVSSSFADIFRNNALKNGLLPIEVPPEELARMFGLVGAEPDASITVDLETEELRLADGSSIGFHVDAFARRMILDGTDELGYLLSLEPEITAYDDLHPARVSTLG
jgi:3-isopropylmalate/(R)-2-methylmalate dehydratase small subunit